MSNVSIQDWKDFKNHHVWKELVETIKARMLLITQDILSPDLCNTEAKLAALQGEYHGCLWFINLPEMCITETEVGKGTKDEIT